jgi:hypothetical protein
MFAKAGRPPLVVCDLGQLRFTENDGRPALFKPLRVLKRS